MNTELGLDLVSYDKTHRLALLYLRQPTQAKVITDVDCNLIYCPFGT
jgi:hypothetical protein